MKKIAIIIAILFLVIGCTITRTQAVLTKTETTIKILDSRDSSKVKKRENLFDINFKNQLKEKYEN